ncbi:nuclear transport factor 2 family protein [Acrocarpospora macrocephala]|uniref:Steroid Delta-isomerase n=1 Tax=Acrocarpospora macrocephala TaxID=150177 RepID=A0A5M3X2U0_9ACTN|nr:nuclear transport factor 2 family protein [Acrocarpospora macrocephala]GES12598.1 steroid Delta-isomerase [Acrocarpospora macrocephala]
MPSETTMRTAMQAYLDALNNRDVARIIALFAEGGTVEDPVGSGVHDARPGLTRLVGGLPDGATFTLDTPIRASHGSGAAMAFTVRMVLDGKPIQIRSLDVMQFDDEGLITEMKAYYGPSDITS